MVMPNEETEAAPLMAERKLFKEPVSRNPVLGTTLHLTGNGLQKANKAPQSRTRPKLRPFLP